METQQTLPERPKGAGNTSQPKKQPKASKPAKEPKPPPVKKGKSPNVPTAPMDPNSMFKEGFLKSVHHENPAKKIVTRFPPEPNGYLHIGHSKAIAVNFGFARYHDGVCYLRFDDTNPEAEEEIYFASIQETVEWLGFNPVGITYSSDNFQKLYDLAEDLIKRDGAYVCHCTGKKIWHCNDESLLMSVMSRYRGQASARRRSPWTSICMSTSKSANRGILRGIQSNASG